MPVAFNGTVIPVRPTVTMAIPFLSLSKLLGPFFQTILLDSSEHSCDPMRMHKKRYMERHDTHLRYDAFSSSLSIRILKLGSPMFIYHLHAHVTSQRVGDDHVKPQTEFVARFYNDG